MHELAHLAGTGAKVYFIGLYLIVAYQMLTGRIGLAGLLRDKSSGDFDSGRLQMFVVTLLVAGAMFLRLDEMATTHRLSLPSDWLLLVLGGSQGLYMVRKFLQVRGLIQGGTQ